MNRRVVVIGLGAVTPLGPDFKSSWFALTAGKSGIRPLRGERWSGLPVSVAGVASVTPPAWLDAQTLRRVSRFSLLSLLAAHDALDEANVALSDEFVATVIGSGMGGVEDVESAFSSLASRGWKGISPLTVPRAMSNAAAAAVSAQFRFRGPSFSVSSACASGAHSIGIAFDLIRSGACDFAVAGGAEAPVVPLTLASFSSARALSKKDGPEASSPFDADRSGFVLSEGAGILVLAAAEIVSAHFQDTVVLAEMIGWASTSDPQHAGSTLSSCRGQVDAMLGALRNSGVHSPDVCHVNAHATGTVLGDPVEASAIRQLFPPDRFNVAVSSTKGATGHMIGASGAVSAAFTVAALVDHVAPPTLNLSSPVQESEGLKITAEPQPLDVQRSSVALSNSFGFGGTNVCLAFRRGLVSR